MPVRRPTLTSPTINTYIHTYIHTHIHTYKSLSKPRDIVNYTTGSVTWDWSGCEFTVKHEDSDTYKVTTSSPTIEVKTMAHALQWLASHSDSHIIYVTYL